MQSLNRKPTPEEAVKIQAYYREHPEFFFKYFLGVNAWGKQLEIARSIIDNRVTTVRSCHAAGKGLAIDTPIATPNGWTTMGALKEGDLVFDQYGRPVSIRAVHPVKNIDCYRVSFDDGTHIVCDKDHLWTTIDFKTRHRLTTYERTSKRRLKDWRKYWREAQTANVVDLADRLKYNDQNSQLIPLTAPLSLPEQKYELDPYVFGLWLGDGTSVRTDLTDPAHEHIEQIQALGYTPRFHSRGRAYYFWQKGDGIGLLRRLGVYKDKHIPDNYMRGSTAQRLALLQGLMDSDGHCDGRGRLELTLTNQRLAEDACALIASLGFKTSVRVSDAKLNGRFISKRWRIMFTSETCPFRLKRKVERWHSPNVQASRTTARMITGIQKIDSVPTRCITLDNEEGIFLAGRQLVPTHNSYIASCIAIWYLSSFKDSIVVTTAPTWRQVKDILWRNINTRYAKAKIPLGGEVPNATGWQISSNWFAIGVSSKDPDKIQGYHAESGNLLVICDEAAGIEEPIFEGIDALLTGAKCRKLEIGNPTSSSGTFRENHKPNAETHRIRISAFDTPNFTANGIRNEAELEQAMKEVKKGQRELKLVADYLISPIWVYERLKKWGANNPIYRARVLAEFPDVGDSNLVPLSLIEAACTDERLDKILGLHLPAPLLIGPDGKLLMSEAKFEKIEAQNKRIRQEKLAEYIASHSTSRGVDVAYQGSDASVIQPRWGSVVGVATEYHGQDPSQLAGRVWSTIQNLPTDATAVDVIGIGEGVVSTLHTMQLEHKAVTGEEHWARIIRVDVRNTPKDTPIDMPMMHFPNKRHELYWKLRERFQAGDIYLMPDEDGNPPEDLMAELSAIEYQFRGNKIFVEEKADMKKRLHGKSPDHADALMLSFATGDTVVWQSEPEPEPDEDDDWEPPSHGADGDYSYSSSNSLIDTNEY